MGKTATENTQSSQQSQQQGPSAPQAPQTPQISPQETLANDINLGRKLGIPESALQQMASEGGLTQEQYAPSEQMRPMQSAMPSVGRGPNILSMLAGALGGRGSSRTGNLIGNIANIAGTVQGAAISTMVPANRNDNVLNLQDRPNLNPNQQESNATINPNQHGIEPRLAAFLQVNNSNWTNNLTEYYGLQQQAGVAA